MAIKTEDFEALTIGDHAPFDGFTSDINSGVTIVSGGTPTGGVASTKACHVRGSNLIYDTYPLYNTNVSIFFDLYLIQERFQAGEAADIFQIRCNKATLGITDIINFKVEADTTLSVYTGVTRICNSGDFIIRLLTWNFIQLNITLTTTIVGGISVVQIAIHLAVNGVEVASGTVGSGIQISTLDGTAAHFNIWQFSSSEIIIDNIVFDTHQSIITYPNAGTPFNKINQGNAEIPLLPDSGMVSVFMGASELEILPDSAQLNIYQGVVELILLVQTTPGLWKVQEI